MFACFIIFCFDCKGIVIAVVTPEVVQEMEDVEVLVEVVLEVEEVLVEVEVVEVIHSRGSSQVKD
jgi:hypothetical protein